VRADERVVIVDYGSQYTQLIARRTREQHIYCEVVPPWVSARELADAAPRALILSGGPASVGQGDAPGFNQEILDLGVPILGICYGLHLLVQHLGGVVESAPEREYGRAQLEIQIADAPLFEGVPRSSVVWMSHGDWVATLPECFEVIGTSENSPYAAIRHRSLPIYAVQFHPEVAHTEAGDRILGNFLGRIAGIRGSWTMDGFIESQLRELREKIAEQAVICGVSGGVDSTVVAVLMHRAIGEQLHCIFVDNGLLRANEVEEVQAIFRSLDIPLVTVDASTHFLERLAGVEDPEEKRVRIGHTFIAAFEKAAAQISGAQYLAQGTLYPDVIESVSVWGPSATIKTHHNVGGLPERMQLEVVEPLRMLFKDEVRELADVLGIPRAVSWRHPFPGPGLGIRVVGEVTTERLDRLRAADRIVIAEVRAAGWYDRLWQAFAVLLPVRSVGVMGDARTYQDTIAVRCVTSRDAMTGDWAQLPPELLGRISSRIINEVHGVNRVVYDISSKPPATIEWE
jgi:GMP synthase (glutamine-hydrolysing)